jgi:hypothetical protein
MQGSGSANSHIRHNCRGDLDQSTSIHMGCEDQLISYLIVGCGVGRGVEGGVHACYLLEIEVLDEAHDHGFDRITMAWRS